MMLRCQDRKSITAQSILGTVIVHEDFDGITQHGHDIALIRLQTPLTFNDYVQPVCLPSTPVPDRPNCVITGWGDTQSTLDRVFCSAKLPFMV